MKVDKSSALTWLHEWMERGFNDVYQSWVISLSAMIRDLARVCVSPLAEATAVSYPAMNFLGFVFSLKTRIHGL